MARIRSIKPEFWSSEQVMACSPIARLLFIGIWNFADDAGRMKFSARTIKAQVFPGDDTTIEAVRGMLDELSAKGLIEVYSVDGVEFFQVTGWHHQRIDKPQKAKHPPNPSDCSSNTPRMLATDLIGEEGIGKESAASDDAPPRTEEAELFERGKQVLGKDAGGMIVRLRKAKDGSIALARAAIEQASTKENPREYIGRILAGPARSPPVLTPEGQPFPEGII